MRSSRAAASTACAAGSRIASGVSWQVVPRQLNEMLESPDRDAARRAMEAMLEMKKLDIAKLREAFEGVPA